MRRSRKAKQQAVAQLSAPLALSDDAAPHSATTQNQSGGSPQGMASPDDPMSEEAIFERTSESGWYVVDDDGYNRPVAYRRTPRFDDRTERTAMPKMLFRATAELPEWVQASNRLWLVRQPCIPPPPTPVCSRPLPHIELSPCFLCAQPRCFVSVAEPPRSESPPGVRAAPPLVESVTEPSLAHGSEAVEAPEVWTADAADDTAGSISGGVADVALDTATGMEEKPLGSLSSRGTTASGGGCMWASFRILGTEQVPGANGKPGFTRYRLCTSTTNGHSWVVLKRYSDFQNLRQRLVEAGAQGISSVPFPKKKLRRKTSVREETVEVRTDALQHWCG